MEGEQTMGLSMRKVDEGEPAAKVQGRPPNTSKEQGRERLIEKARDAMRLEPKLDIPRRDIAESAGVTPALVSYYFPDRTDLLELAAQPVVDSYVSEVEQILASNDGAELKLERLIVVFLTFHSEQGSLLDHLIQISHLKSKAGNMARLRAVEGMLTAFFEELIEKGVVRAVSPSLVGAVLWGICRHIGRRHSIDVFRVSPDVADEPRDVAADILRLLKN